MAQVAGSETVISDKSRSGPCIRSLFRMVELRGSFQTAAASIQLAIFRCPSQASGPGLLEWVVLILVPGLAGELPTMVVCGHRVSKGQG